MDDMKQGKWVLDEDMHPFTNISGRKFKDAFGREHIAHSLPLPARPYAWWFPAGPR